MPVTPFHESQQGEEMMTNENLCFQRKTPAPDGIHDDIQFNEYVPDGTRWVTIGQLFGGTMIVFGLLIAYIIVGNLELGM